MNGLTVITGAASGIGLATVERLIGQVKVVAIDIDEEALNALPHPVAARKSVDVSDPQAVQAVFAELREEFEPVAALINVAGIGSVTNVANTDFATWSRVMGVNATGTFNTMHEVLPDMVLAGRGNIINVASVGGMVGLHDRAAYCASKAAVIGLTKAAAVDHAADGIRVNCVCPGTIHTPWVDRLLADAGDREAGEHDLRAR